MKLAAGLCLLLLVLTGSVDGDDNLTRLMGFGGSDLSWDVTARRSIEQRALRTLDEGTIPSSVDGSSAQIYAFNDGTRRIRQRYRLRGEFEPQSALMVSGSSLVSLAPDVLVDLCRATRNRVPLVMLVNNEEDVIATSRLLAGRRLPRLPFAVVPHDSAWARDYGPIVLATDAQAVVVDAFYGNTDRSNDDAVPAAIANLVNTHALETPLTLPGGNLISNGRGICVTTTRLQEENPGLSQAEIARSLAESLEASTVAMLEPLRGESTGHVDMFATFTSADTVVVGQYRHSYDEENAAILDRNADLLASVRVGRRQLCVVRIPMPARIEDTWPTFTNVVYANGRLLVPTYRSTMSREKRHIEQLYASLLPGWHIYFIRSDDLILQGGALHCVVSNLSTLAPLRQGGLGR